MSASGIESCEGRKLAAPYRIGIAATRLQNRPSCRRRREPCDTAIGVPVDRTTLCCRTGNPGANQVVPRGIRARAPPVRNTCRAVPAPRR